MVRFPLKSYVPCFSVVKVEEEFEESFVHNSIEENKIDSKKYACGSCTSAFAQKKSLMTHIRYACGKPARYRCPYCLPFEQHFYTLPSYGVLLPQELSTSPRFKCPYCAKLSKLRSNMYKHVRGKHQGRDVWAVDLHET
ncbi:zinc finger protein 710-like [Belonocnema kinseyi]|uniref:zinc finger protein 710-like n=1 Tax=Belonocnema kinseyi TaxID=2817044 RepID=UPI00143D96A5|nr:zinc finger protein 710-like [Belonocnema kinseyi]